jgi:hypothetical protein
MGVSLSNKTTKTTKKMTKVMIYGRSRFAFAKLFPDAIFEGYECNIRFAYFTFKNKISEAKIKRIAGKIAIIEIDQA